MRATVTRRNITVFFELLPLVASAAVAAIAIIVFLGWASNAQGMRALFITHVPMLPITATAFMFGAISLWFGSRSERIPSYGIVAIVFGFMVTIIAGVTIVEYALHMNLGMDLLLFPNEVLSQPWKPPGRMAANSAVAMFFTGLALIAIPSDGRKNGVRSQYLAAVALTAAFLAIVGYVFHVSGFYSLARNTAMAPITSLSFLILNLGIVLSVRSAGLSGLLVDHTAAGMLTRRLLPAAIFVPLFFGWLRIGGERAGHYESSLGVALYAVASIVVFVAVVIWAARVVRQADNVKSDFLAVMSHELRTPLSAILGYEELLADGITGPVNETQKQQLGRIKNSAQHLLGLIDQILTFSRLDAGKQEISIQPVSVNALMEQSAELVQPLARERGIGFEVDTLNEPLKIKTDVQKCSQILVNLLSNAVKFTDNGKVTLEAQISGDHLCFIVRDTGIGISPKHMELIFDPFWQVEQKATRRAGGTGLGLSVSRQLARLLGGEITVSSKAGEGSTFMFTLPKHARR